MSYKYKTRGDPVPRQLKKQYQFDTEHYRGRRTMVTQPKTPSYNSIPQPLSPKLHWDNDDPATPALIRPMFEDDYYTTKEYIDASWNDPKFQKALKVAEEYLAKFIKQTNADFEDALTIRDLGIAARHFIDGFMAATTGKIKLF